MTLFTRKSQWPTATKTGIAARSNSGMVKPVETVRGSRHLFSDSTPWIANATARVFLTITLLLAITGGGLTLAKPAQGVETEADAQTSTPAGPLTFDDSVRIAITRSPYFRKSSLEIEIKKMDESDSRFGMFPTVTFRTLYYVNYPHSVMVNPAPYSLSFVSDPYNPIVSYFSLQAQKLATQVAILAHLKTISMGLVRLGNSYLELEALKKLSAYQREIVNLSRENITYAQNRLSIGTGTSLELKLAQQELQLAQAEQEQITQAQKRIIINLKNFLALKSNQEITLDLHDTRQQVLGKFSPQTTSLAQAKSCSYELKTLEIYKQLQEYNVKLAFAKIFPTVLLNTQNPDPLSNTDVRGLYVGVGLQVPVWDGLTRIRNVSRQKAILKQFGAEKETKEDDLEDKWQGTAGEIQERDMALKAVRSQEELARLKNKQDEVRYQSGEVLLPVVLKSRQQVLEAQKDAVRKNLDYEKAVLHLREISGDLGNTYVRAESWRN
jgi:outer membrane protein TolC